MTQVLLPSARTPALARRGGVGRSSLRAGRVIVGTAVSLLALGLVMLYSSTSASGVGRSPARETTLVLARQLRWVFLAVLAGWAAAALPPAWLRRAARPLLLGSLLLLGAVLVLGAEVNNSRRWLHVLGISVQPSELFKLALLLYLADRLAAREEAVPFGTGPAVAPFLAPVAIGALLILVEPDLGTSLFVVAEAAVLLALAGVSPRRFLPFVATVAPLLLLYGYTRFAHVRERLAGAGAQVEESLVAIGSGGLLGRGLGAGTQKLGYVPEASTDFIFAVIGEELGFLGCGAVVVAFMVLAWCGRRVAWNARILGPHAYYLAAGAAFVVVFQALINVAVVTAVAPTKGIPLPFISQGGSNLVVMCAAVGLLAGVARRTAGAAGDDPWA